MDAETADRHSVTCAVCGELADERETQDATVYPEEFVPATFYEDPLFAATILTIVGRHGEGEVHQSCFRDVRLQIEGGPRWAELQVTSEGVGASLYAETDDQLTVVEETGLSWADLIDVEADDDIWRSMVEIRDHVDVTDVVLDGR